MIKRKQYGFTIVELLIVIVIIAILAAITIVAYNGIQQRAQDSKVLNAAQQLQKAYMVSILKGKQPYLGGYSSSYNSATNTCSGGFGGWVDDQNYSYSPSFCTMATVLINANEIPSTLVKDMPKTNKVYTDYTAGNKAFMFNACTATSYALTYALNQPRADQQTQLQDTCNGGSSWAPFSTYGMNAGVILTIPG